MLCFDPTALNLRTSLPQLCSEPNDLTISAVVQESRTTSDALLTLTLLIDGSEIRVQLTSWGWLVVYPIIYRVLYIPFSGWPWDFWTINSFCQEFMDFLFCSENPSIYPMNENVETHNQMITLPSSTKKRKNFNFLLLKSWRWRHSKVHFLYHKWYLLIFRGFLLVIPPHLHPQISVNQAAWFVLISFRKASSLWSFPECNNQGLLLENHLLMGIPAVCWKTLPPIIMVFREKNGCILQC